MADEPENSDTEAGDFTAQVVTYGPHALVAPKGWEVAAKRLKTPLLWMNFEPFSVKRLCIAPSGAWAWRDVTATDSTAKVVEIRGEK